VATGQGTGRTWRRAGLAAVVAAAVLLFGATLWVTQGGGPGLSGAAGAGTTTPAPVATGEGQGAGTPAPAGPDQPAAPAEVPVTGAPADPPADVPADDAAPLPELPPVPFTEQVAPVPGVVVSIGDLEAVTGEAQGPGEVGGPALRFTLTLRNDGDAALSLESTVVTVYSGPEQTPALELREPGGVPLPAEIAPGATATGVFVFTVPPEQRGQVKIGIDYTVGVPIVVFEGAAPR
jgi:hypothetical protein